MVLTEQFGFAFAEGTEVETFVCNLSSPADKLEYALKLLRAS